jgi:hypothetical protein
VDGLRGGEESPLGVLSSPLGWARLNLHFLDAAPVAFGSLEESLAIQAWRKRQRIELLRTIAVVTATVNPERASQALHRLIEEQFPEHAIEREKAVERALEIMDREKTRVYSVTPTDTKASGLGRLRGVLSKRRRRDR